MSEEYQKVFKGKYGSYNRYPRNDNDKILAAFSYFNWIIALIVLLAVKPMSPYLRYHAVQALGLTISIMLLFIVTIFLCIFLIGLILLPFVWLLSFYPIVMMILVLIDNDHRIPWLSNYVEMNYV